MGRLVLILGLFGALAVTAAPPISLEKKLASYRNLKDVRIRFEQVKHFLDLDLEIRSSGFLVLEKSGIVRWQVQKPQSLEVEIGAENIQIRAPGKKTQTLSLKSSRGGSSLSSVTALATWLRLDAEKIEAQYDWTMAPEDWIFFVPKARQSSLMTRLEARFQDGWLQELKIREKSGDHLRLTFDRPEPLE